MAGNKFTGLRQAIKERDASTPDTPAEQPVPKPRRPRLKWGKSSNPAYRQVTAYILDDTYQQVQQKVVERGEGNFSDLVQKLLSTWLQSKK